MDRLETKSFVLLLVVASTIAEEYDYIRQIRYIGQAAFCSYT